MWPSTREEGRSGVEYNEYEELLESTGDHSGERGGGRGVRIFVYCCRSRSAVSYP